jgi:uncharacterized membrane protein
MPAVLAFLLLLLLVFGVSTTLHFLIWIALAVVIIRVAGYLLERSARRGARW